MFAFVTTVPVYTMTGGRKGSKKDCPPSPPPQPPPLTEPPPSLESLQPAIDGPPSPERIRAYTEQMKRSSIFGNNSRTNTFSSSTPSFRSQTSSSDNASLSRKSSHRSNSSSMPSTRSERPESVQIFGALFSRSGRKSRKENRAGGSRGSSSSININDSVIEEESAKNHYQGKTSSSQKRHIISGPTNFQHVTHTHKDHLPNLERTSRMDLVSEFSAIRASQAPTNGELKGIRAQDLHFENFSSEALSVAKDERPVPPLSTPRSPRQQNRLRKSSIPPPRLMGITKSHDNLRAPPPRPPRSPLSPTCPIALPARTSSRTASVLFEKFDPLAATTIERPHRNGGFRKPAPFSPPVPPPSPTWDEQQGGHLSRPLSHPVTTLGDESWPLTASVSGTFGVELPDVQEEEEDIASRRSRTSVELRDLRASQSVPALRRRSLEKANGSTETLSRIPSNDTTVPATAQLDPAFELSSDSWESDIDWCYENEVEADCDYKWDCAEGNDSVRTETTPIAEPPLELSVQNDERVYRGRFRPSLLVSSPYDLPELSPISNTSTPSTDPRTPAFLQPQHARSPSHASSFKESHGFNLSPTLLIPADFQLQMEQDAMYQEQFVHDTTTSANIFVQEPYGHSFSPVDENESSTASYRSSNLSRGSARSSSSTRISSAANSRGSQDSILLLSRAASLSKAHNSISSAASLPDLIHSMHHQHQSTTDLATDIAALSVSIESLDSAPAPGIVGPAPALASLQHRRNKSLAMEQGLRTMTSMSALSTPSIQVDERIIELCIPGPATTLSPVPESFPEFTAETEEQKLVHGRKVSAPVVSQSVREFKGRARAATSVAGKVRGSYGLFPQV